MRRILPSLFLAGMASLLLGCGVNAGNPALSAGATFIGKVFGGQQPIVGSRVYLLAVGTGGYGTASTSLLTQSISGTDAIGGYVLTGAGGSFSVTGDYTCTVGQQVYLLAMGGDPTGGTSGSVNNSGIGLMAALGNCPAAGTLAVQLPIVSINEVTTVVAAYALGGFTTDASHISSSGSAQALTGVANAFRTAANMVNPVNGIGYDTTPIGGGTVPLAELNTLANILATCVNTTSSASSGCTQLFGLALSGGSTGTTPTETATAMISIAHHPGTNTASIYALAPAGVGTPFQPSLSSQPNDFGVGIVWPITSASGNIGFDSAGNLWTSGNGLVAYSNAGALLSPVNGYTGGGVTGTSAGNAYLLSIDPGDNVWVTTYNSTVPTASFINSYLSKFSNAGVALSPSTGFTGGGLFQPTALAIDGSGNVWAGNGAGSTLSEFTNAGVAATGSPISSGGLPYVFDLAIDNSGNVWSSSMATPGTTPITYSLTEFSNAGSQIRQPVTASSSDYDHLSVDSSNNLWGTVFTPPCCSSTSNQIFKLTSTGSAASGFPATVNAALQACGQTQIDGNGNMWCASDDDSIAEISSTGVSLSPSAGYVVPNIYGPLNLAIDSSGNVWTTGNYDPSINTKAVELVGAAAPVITPLSLAIQLGKLGTKP